MQEGRKEVKEVKEDELTALCRSRQTPSSGTRYESEKELTFEPPVSNNDFYHYLTSQGINYLTLLSEPIIDCQGYQRISIRLKLAPAHAPYPSLHPTDPYIHSESWEAL